MLGNWAAKNLPQMGADELTQFQAIIAMENPDLYVWLTGQKPVPEGIDNMLLRRVCEDCVAAMQEKVTIPSTGNWEGKTWE